MNAARSQASDWRSTSRSVRIEEGGQTTGPSSVMAGNLSLPARVLQRNNSRSPAPGGSLDRRTARNGPAHGSGVPAQRLPSLVQRNGFPFLSRRKTRLCGERAVREVVRSAMSMGPGRRSWSRRLLILVAPPASTSVRTASLAKGFSSARVPSMYSAAVRGQGLGGRLGPEGPAASLQTAGTRERSGCSGSSVRVKTSLRASAGRH